MEDMYYVAVTAIVVNDDNKVLITKRHPNKSKWPNKWTVPGGRLDRSDFFGKPTDINNQWYDTLIAAVRREVKEETNLEITDIAFLCDIAIPDTVIISFTARAAGGEIKLQDDECVDYAWVDAKEAEEYDLIDGILDEIRLALA